MILFISINIAIKIHDDQIDSYGGLKGVRDHGLLKSALEMPKASFGGHYVHPSMYDKAAAYLFHIVKNHPFIDGNKRTGAALALAFLRLNNIEAKINMKELEELVVATAEGLIAKNQISEFLAGIK